MAKISQTAYLAQRPQTGKTVLFRMTKHGVVASAWPRKRKHATTFMMAAANGAMRYAIEQIKNPDPLDYRVAVQWVQGTGLIPRDILLQALWGKNIEFTTVDGKTYRWLSMTERSIQGLLDLIGSQQGTILYRASDTWRPLLPGSSGRVLTTHGPSADPTWEPGGGSGGGYPGGWIKTPDGAAALSRPANTITCMPFWVAAGTIIRKLSFMPLSTSATAKTGLAIYRSGQQLPTTLIDDCGGLVTGVTAGTLQEFTLSTPYEMPSDDQLWIAHILRTAGFSMRANGSWGLTIYAGAQATDNFPATMPALSLQSGSPVFGVQA